MAEGYQFEPTQPFNGLMEELGIVWEEEEEEDENVKRAGSAGIGETISPPVEVR